MQVHDAVKILRMIRKHIVLGGILAFILGAFLAVANGGTFDLGRVALFYTIALFGDLSTHYSNDHFDISVDKHVKSKKFFSGSHILIDNPKLRPLTRSISIGLLCLSCILAIIAVLFRAAPIELLIITLTGNFLGWFYSAPPLRLTSRGLGEVTIALAAGFAIPAVGYLSVRGQFDPLFVYFALPFMLYGFMLSLSLEAPDIGVDRKTGKRNLGVRKGEKAVSVLIVAAALAATLMFLVYAGQISGTSVDFGVVALFSAVPLAVGLIGLIAVLQKKPAPQFYTANVVALFFFNILMVAYFIAIALPI